MITTGLTAAQAKRKKELLSEPIEHIDFTKLTDAVSYINKCYKMGFSSREMAQAAKIYLEMLRDPDCSIWLTIAGSAGAAGCLKIFADLVRYGMIDVVGRYRCRNC